ncbi:hypothetical protein GGR58DRAFT_26315 [Xylaria digitata]|nr:hypothetical protein GGR58DRAFT_26315 [Xylaria digitata]
MLVQVGFPAPLRNPLLSPPRYIEDFDATQQAYREVLMSGKKNKRLQGSARKQGTGGNCCEPAGSQISGFSVSGAQSVTVGSNRYVKGGRPWGVDICRINSSRWRILRIILREHRTRSTRHPLLPGHRDNSPINRPIGGRSRHTQNDMASSDRWHKTSTDSLPRHQETPENQHTPQSQDNAKTLAERKQCQQPQTQHRAGGLTGNDPGQHEVRIG